MRASSSLTCSAKDLAEALVAAARRAAWAGEALAATMTRAVRRARVDVMGISSVDDTRAAIGHSRSEWAEGTRTRFKCEFEKARV